MDEEDKADIDMSANCFEVSEELGDLPKSPTYIPCVLKFSFGQTELSPAPIFKDPNTIKKKSLDNFYDMRPVKIFRHH